VGMQIAILYRCRRDSWASQTLLTHSTRRLLTGDTTSSHGLEHPVAILEPPNQLPQNSKHITPLRFFPQTAKADISLGSNSLSDRLPDTFRLPLVVEAERQPCLVNPTSGNDVYRARV
jgi:hypothetical protein